MENEIVERFELINKRIDDNKTLIATIVSAGTAVFAVVAIIFSWNLNNERADLKELRNELRAEVKESLGKTKNFPYLEIYNENESVLTGTIVDTKVDRNENDVIRINCSIILRNIGGAPTGQITIKPFPAIHNSY